MKFFVITTNLKDYFLDIKNGFKFIGLPERNKRTLVTLVPGDRIFFYISKLGLFAAEVEVTGPYFYSTSKVWSDDVFLYPCRVHTKPLLFEASLDKMIDVRLILDDLEMITNKRYWGTCFMGSFRTISEKDARLLENKLKEKNRR